ncbi:response regulator [Pectobacterium versatile]|uniref:response regulator n=1 Tax=Pectobacterium versatile TaxID=2488639 RepID=UPI00102E3623|nr:response regulator [Pectobacterium versatile]TAI97898.1 response regulator [Pectobacterium versatile]UEQ08779.1 response regulator [Pectobacterium versatile]
MKLEYKILWFEDQPHNVAGPADGIKDRLYRAGFKLTIEWVKTIGDVNSFIGQLRKKNDFDLILMDWNLGTSIPNGASLAKRVRNNAHTEIVFYSSAAPNELREAIYKEEIDGVYCTRRDNLISETMAVINTTIKKVLDLNHMRGIVMAVVSDFDNLIDECLHIRYSQQCPQGQENTAIRIKEKIIQLCKSNLEEIEKIDTTSDVNALLKNRVFSSMIKYQTLKALLSEKIEDRTINNLMSTFTKYEEQVIRPRNILAHAVAVEESGKIYFKNKDISLGEEEFRILRQNLLSHSDALNDIKQAILSGLLD